MVRGGVTSDWGPPKQTKQKNIKNIKPSKQTIKQANAQTQTTNNNQQSTTTTITTIATTSTITTATTTATTTSPNAKLERVTPWQTIWKTEQLECSCPSVLTFTGIYTVLFTMLSAERLAREGKTRNNYMRRNTHLMGFCPRWTVLFFSSLPCFWCAGRKSWNHSGRGVSEDTHNQGISSWFSIKAGDMGC